MKATDDAFALIKSLTKSERRYFKLYAAKQGSEEGCDYIQLFDMIDAMDHNDDQALRRELGEEKARYLPQMKYYLYRTILRALNQFHASSNNAAQINELLQAYDVLYAKRLHHQCRKLLAKARKLATRYDSLTHLSQILVREYHLAILEPDSDRAREQVGEIFDQMIAVSEQGLLRNKYWRIQALMFIATKRPLPDARQGSWVKELMNDPLLEGGEPEDDPFAQLLYGFIHHHDAIVRQDLEGSYYWSRRIVDLIEEVEQFHDSIKRQIPAQHNLCMAIVQTGRVDEFDREYRKLLGLATRARETNPHFDDLTIRMLEPRFELGRGDFAKAVELLTPLEEQFRSSGEALRIGFSTYFNYLFAYSYFGSGDYRRSLAWLGNVLNDRNVSTHEELHCHARMLNLLVHYELGNFENLEFYLASAVRFLTRRNKLLATESLVIDTIRKLIAAPDAKAKQRILSAALKKSQEITTSRIGAYASLDPAAWIESKLTGESFASIAQRRLASTAIIADHHDVNVRSALCA